MRELKTRGGIFISIANQFSTPVFSSLDSTPVFSSLSKEMRFIVVIRALSWLSALYRGYRGYRGYLRLSALNPTNQIWINADNSD